jgi:Cyclophilin type peptidyl-prolyl cis-trans isomerase/CLD
MAVVLAAVGGWWVLRSATRPVPHPHGAAPVIRCYWDRPTPEATGETLPSWPSPIPIIVVPEVSLPGDPFTVGPTTKYVGLPPTGALQSGSAVMRVNTNLGVVTIAMDQKNAPCTTTSFRFLASRGYFDHSRCHRLTTKETIFIL